MKRKSIKRLSLALVATLLLTVFSGCAQQANGGSGDPENSGAGTQSDTGTDTPAKTIELSLAYHGSATAPNAIEMDVWAQEIFEATEGRVKITNYHGGVLGAATDGLDMLETGVCDILWTTTGFYPGWFPYSDVFLLPMLGVPDGVTGTKVYWDLMERFPEAFNPEMEDYKILMAKTGPVGVLASTKEILIADDLSGMNIRTLAGPLNSAVQMWGASPVSMSPADLYLSMEKGVLDGYFFDISGVATWNLYDVSPYMLDASFFVNPIMYFMNKDKWDSIPAEDQAIIESFCGRDGSVRFAQVLEEEGQDAIAAMAAAGNTYTVATDAQIATFQPVADQAAADWITAQTTDSIDAQAILDFAKERIEFYQNGG